jgi:YHS domain-containing protein
MKKSSFVLTCVTVLAFASAALAGETNSVLPAKGKSAELKQQTHCPVMGGKIDSTEFTDIQGQRVYHCCSGCGSKLKANPDKYFEKAAAEGVLFENIQTACPVTGKPMDKSIFTDYKGRRVYFATAAAKEDFLKAPSKYLAVLDDQVHKGSMEDKKVESHDHSGHGGHMDIGGGHGH